jgi:excisionase family DNA binding protein
MSKEKLKTPAAKRTAREVSPQLRSFIDNANDFDTPSGGLDRLLTVEEVAGLLQVPASWVYGHTRKRSLDRIPGFRLGKYWRFREADVLAWLERQRAGN